MRNTLISADMKRSYFTKKSYVAVDHCLCLPPQCILSLVSHKFRSRQWPVSSIEKKWRQLKQFQCDKKLASFTRYRCSAITNSSIQSDWRRMREILKSWARVVLLTSGSVNKTPVYVIASFPTQAQNTIFCRVCGLSSSTAIMGRMHAPGWALFLSFKVGIFLL